MVREWRDDAVQSVLMRRDDAVRISLMTTLRAEAWSLPYWLEGAPVEGPGGWSMTRT